LLPKRAVQVMDSSPMLGAAAVQDTSELLRTALHKLVKGRNRELPAELMPRLKRCLQTGKAGEGPGGLDRGPPDATRAQFTVHLGSPSGR